MCGRSRYATTAGGEAEKCDGPSLSTRDAKPMNGRVHGKKASAEPRRVSEREGWCRHEERRDEVDAQLPGSASVTDQGTAGLDLRAGILRQLGALDVRSVEIDERFTREDQDLFSHRRSSPTGRFAAVVRL